MASGALEYIKVISTVRFDNVGTGTFYVKTIEHAADALKADRTEPGLRLGSAPIGLLTAWQVMSLYS
jgi:hypothetical protein